MDNLNNQNSNSNNSNSEVSMSNENTIIELFQSFLSNGGAPKVTSFKKHLDQLINANVKPLCVRSGKTADGNDWRSELKSQFGGRGQKWVFIALSEIESTLIKFETAGIDCTDYRQFTKDHGKAWIRFSGGRINDNLKSAAFEVRINGSKLDHPKQLHYISMDNLDIIETMIGTPNSLKLEAIAKPEETTDEVANEEVATEIEVAVELSEPETAVIEENNTEEEFDMSQLDDEFADLHDEFDVDYSSDVDNLHASF